MPHIEKFLIDGEIAPSVTEVIGILSKPYLAIWRGKIGNKEADRIMNSAAELGRNVHNQVELYCAHKEVKDPHDLFKVWYKWFCDEGYAIQSSEIHVVSKKHRYHGSFDAILTDDGEAILVDWKFSKSEDHLRLLQLAGYAIAYKEQTGEVIKRGMIVCIHPETGKVSVTNVKNLWKYAPLFLALRKVYDFYKYGGNKSAAKRSSKTEG